MEIQVCSSLEELGQKAASDGVAAINRAVSDHGEANILVATGASQFSTLGVLTAQTVEWTRVEAFHLDEYVGLSADHPASFRRYLRERFVSQISGLRAFHEVGGDSDTIAELSRLNALIKGRRIDVAFIGIGENGHLAFNDPPADFAEERPYIVVRLDHKCRQQQVGEGWFPSVEAVPEQAISMSISQILRATTIVVSVPDQRKAQAVRDAVEGPVDPSCPASILQQHPDCTLYLDKDSASLLSG